MLNHLHIMLSRFRRMLAAALVAVVAAQGAAASEFRDFIHTYTNTAAVGTVFVDANGTAWVGTTNGLMQYDDLKRDYSIRLSMPEELRVPIHLIYGLNDGRIVVITRSMKKYVFDPVSYGVEEINSEWLSERDIEVPGPWTIEIIGKPDSPALIVAGNKVFTLDAAPGHKAKLIDTLDRNVVSLSCDGKNYHAVTPSYIYTLDPATGAAEKTAFPFETFAAHVIKDSKGNIWLGDKDLHRFDATNHSWQTLRHNLMVTEITISGPDIYVGTSASGILHYGEDGTLLTEIHNNPFDINTPVSDHCAHVYVDSSDNLWVTYNKCDLSISSHYYDITKGRHIDDLQRQRIKDDIISLLPVDDNTVVAGTDGNGLFVVDAETGTSLPESRLLRSKVQDAAITALFLDSRKRLWIGSYRSGLICVNNGAVSRFLPDTSPYSIVEDIDGNIFVGTSGNGLFRIPAGLQGAPEPVKLDDEGWIQKLSCDRSGRLFAATTYSLYEIDTRTLTPKTLIGPGSNSGRKMPNILNSFYRDSRSLLWMAGDNTPGSLNILDTANDTIYTLPSLADVKFMSVVEDNDKNMWLAAENDIYNIVPQYDPATKSYSFRHYVYHIRSNETTPNRFNTRAVARMHDGRLIFGGMNGYQVVDPGKYQQLGQLASIKGRLSGLKVNNNFVIPNRPVEGTGGIDKAIGHVDKITLKSTGNNLNFLFSPHDYDSPFKIEYYYRIDHSKNEWYPIEGNSIELMNLNPGRYHLEVCAMSPEGLMTGEVDGVDIEILSPWYFTVWAYIVYLVLLAIVLIAVIYYFIDRQKQKLHVAQAEKEVDRQRQLNEMKLQFFTNISHDFRTPLSLIITPLEAYLGNHNDSETRHFLKPVHKNALQLLNLVNQILDFRKLDVTGVPLHLSYGDIVSYIREVCGSFNLFSEDSGIDLEVKSGIKSLHMYFDKDKLGKIMMNLLSNAFKYNNEDGKVVIGIDSPDDDSVQITVSDTGRGIPDADKGRIFDRFFQSGNRQHTAMGCGIGLHIVKEFVQMHGGTVDVKDNAPCGTTFVITLPVVRSIESDRAAATPDTDAQRSAAHAMLPASQKTGQDTRSTILLVEDNSDFIDFMEQSLIDDYNVLKASNGEQALELLDRETVDIIISDVMMDRMDGLELCKAVKSDIRTSHVPVILLTAKSLAEDEMRGLESGADDYITKPFSMPILRQRISKLIDENKRSQEKFRRIPDISPSEITITPLDEKFLSDTIKVVEENMSNPDFSVEMLSSRLGMHRTHLYKKLSCITGKTPIEFIRLIRLKRAAQYLAQSQMYISEVAYKVGFNNPRLLSKYFKEEYNMTPREYIRSLGIDNDKKTEE